jgi:hypothetical protein
MKEFKGVLTVFIALVVLVVLTTIFLESQLNKKTDTYKEKAGERIVLNKDTLTIIDYSFTNENFKLSNGQEISFELVKKLKIIK